MFKKTLVKGIISAFMIGVFCTGTPFIAASSNNTAVVYAAAKKVAVCTVDKLNVRTDAGTEFAQLISEGVNVYLFLNEKVNVKGEKKDKDGVKWYKISFKFRGENVAGFVRSDFVKLEDKKTGNGEKKDKKIDKKKDKTANKIIIKESSKYSYKAEVKTKGLRLRIDAGRDKAQYTMDKIGVILPNGQSINITGEKNDSEKVKWYKINTKVDKKTAKGYVLAEFVKLSVDKKAPAYAKVIAKKGASIKVKATLKGNELKDSKGRKVILKKGSFVSIFHEITLSNVKYFKVSFTLDGKIVTGYLRADEIKLIGITKIEETKDNSDDNTTPEDENTDNKADEVQM